MIVLPEPVGAPINTFASEWYKLWKTWVYTGLKYSNQSLYNSANYSFLSALRGKGFKHRSLVFG